eukprot:jgi/Chrzof1/2246/Cz11g08085.t1
MTQAGASSSAAHSRLKHRWTGSSAFLAAQGSHMGFQQATAMALHARSQAAAALSKPLTRALLAATFLLVFSNALLYASTSSFSASPAQKCPQCLPAPTELTSGLPRNLHQSCESDGVIPKIIHQSWKNRDLPLAFQAGRESWVQHNKGWDYKLWTDEDNQQLVATHFPWFLHTYDSFARNIMRADVARYMYMYMYGGVYADLDVECLKPMDSLLKGHGAVLAYMGNDTSWEHSIPNAFMASVPQHPFWLMVLFKVQQLAAKNVQPEHVTGPVALQRAVAELWVPSNSSRLTILGPKLIFPYHWGSNNASEVAICSAVSKNFDPDKCKALYPAAYAVSYWSHSWEKHDMTTFSRWVIWFTDHMGRMFNNG